MKTNTLLTGVAACLIAVSFSACNQSSPDTTKTTPDLTPAATNTAAALAGQTVDAAKQVAGQAVAAVTNAVDTATAQFTGVVASAKQALADKKYQGALDELKKLSNLKLTPEQQKIVDDIKAEAQKLLTNSAVDAAKNLLGK